MRTRIFPLSALLFVFSLPPVQAQTVTTADSSSPGLEIPAAVRKTIRAEKVRPGVEVRFDVLEAVLVGHGVVIPSSAQLRGHVVQSAPVTGSSPSRLSIEIDWAEWQHKRIPLHAFIYGLGRRVFNYEPAGPPCGDGKEQTQLVSHSSILPTPQQPDCDTPLSVNDRAAGFGNDFRHMKLETSLRDGSTTLVSMKKNIHLSGGILVMLRNLPVKTTGAFSEIAEQK